MKVLNVVKLSVRAAMLAVVMTGAFGGAASAAVSQLTLDPSAQLSPGLLHAYLTGTITCDPGDNVSLSGQVVQSQSTSGFGFTRLVCDGASQTYTVDAAVGGGFPGSPSGVFKPGKASAQVTASVCVPSPDPFPECSTTYTDAIIRLQRVIVACRHGTHSTAPRSNVQRSPRGARAMTSPAPSGDDD